MYSKQMDLIMVELRELHGAMIKLLPKECINQHPFDYYREDLDVIVRVTQELTKKYKQKASAMEKCFDVVKNEYLRLAKDINIQESVIPEFTSVLMKFEFLINELERVCSRKRSLQSEIFRKTESVYEILEELGLLEQSNEDIAFNCLDKKDLDLTGLKLGNEIVVANKPIEGCLEDFKNAGLSNEYAVISKLLEERFFNPPKSLNTLDNEISKGLTVKTAQTLYDLFDKEDSRDFYCLIFSLIKEKEISYQKLSKLDVALKILRNEKLEKEKSRRTLFKNTAALISRLGIEDKEVYIEQKIFILEKLHVNYLNLAKEREKEVVELLKEIKNKKDLLNLNVFNFKDNLKRSTSDKEINLSILSTSIVNDSIVSVENDLNGQRTLETSQEPSNAQLKEPINGSITSKNIEFLKEHLARLTEEYNGKIKEIFSNTKIYLEELCKLFTIKMGSYDISSEGIGAMRRKIENLEPKREIYLDILNLIDKREGLIESMKEFEIIASDPRRLFKSSFQLLREEKFRKSAFPSLLKIEEDLFDLLAAYKEKFGEFERDGKAFSRTLREEIDGRIINKSVFINKFDSPMRRRKN